MSSLYPTLSSFNYPNRRMGFLVKKGKREMSLTINLEQVKSPLTTVIFRTWGESEKMALGLAQKFIDQADWKRIGTVIVGDNKALILQVPEDGYKEEN